MKKLLSWILIFVLCLSIAACAPSEEATLPATMSTARDTVPETPTAESTIPDAPVSSTPVEYPSGPILYQVTDSNGHVIWLFGSIHVGREDFYPLPDYVMDAYHEADALAVEADVVAFESDTAAATKLIMGTMYKDGTKVADHIPTELYDRSVEILQENGAYMPTMDLFHVYIWQSMIQEQAMKKMSCDMTLGIDRHLIQDAKDTGKTLLEVESVELQFELLTGFSDEINAVTLASVIAMYDDPEAADAAMIRMMDLWQSGDEAAFAAYVNSEGTDLPEDQQSLYARYMQALQGDRNLTMTDWAEAALADGGNIFICVGAAHVVGEGAMADLLAQRGYTVERITG